MAGALGGLTFWFWLTSPGPTFPSFQQVRSARVGSELVLLDRHGEFLQELRSDSHGRRLDWVPLAEVSPALRNAVVVAEDRRYPRHHGVDWLSLAGVLAGGFRSSSLRGASTITMQLAARLDEELRPHQRRRSVTEKILQIRGALELERHWSKDEILEAYLNLVTFRGELEGVDAAARGLFRKGPQGLNDAESLVLAALLRSPGADVDRVASRACLLNDAMKLQLDKAGLTATTRDALSSPYVIERRVALAPHVAVRLLATAKAAGQARVVSTLDADLQRFATEALRRHLLTLRAQNVHDGALLVVENRSGEVLAYVANLGEYASARFVDGIQAKRQAGSTLKPFLYGLAFENRLLTPASLLDDSPLEVPVQGGMYRPRNYDESFRGLVTARMALASSLNVPAVKTLNLTGVDQLVSALVRFGFHGLREADYYGPSLALGAADITLWDLVNAYRALANGGVAGGLRLTFQESQGEAHRAMSEAAAFLVSDILSDRESRSATFSLESPLSTRFWTAAKTGTSKDMRDNWCIGYSDRYTAGVWAGNFSGEPMWNVSGITGAAPVWAEIMTWLHRDRAGRSPRAPAGVVAQNVTVAGVAQTRREFFLAGTESSTVRDAAGQGNCRIVYPSAGMIVALDPDIPSEQQKLFFEAETGGQNLRWFVDDRLVGPAGPVTLWTPVSGKHTLSLVDESDRALDTVTFEVRG